jgi:hypothetical protein
MHVPEVTAILPNSMLVSSDFGAGPGVSVVQYSECVQSVTNTYGMAKLSKPVRKCTFSPHRKFIIARTTHQTAAT